MVNVAHESFSIQEIYYFQITFGLVKVYCGPEVAFFHFCYCHVFLQVFAQMTSKECKHYGAGASCCVICLEQWERSDVNGGMVLKSNMMGPENKPPLNGAALTTGNRDLI